MKFKNLIKINIHTIFHLITWLVFVILFFIFASPMYETETSFKGIISAEYPLYLIFFIIFIFTGVLFDLVIYFLRKYKKSKAVSVMNYIFFGFLIIFSLILFLIIFSLINWGGQM